MCLVDIIQHMWQTGGIPQDFWCTVLVLIPKGTIDSRGIGLLKTLWKAAEALIDTHIRASLQFHDGLHRLRAVRGTGTSIMELNIPQELSSEYHDPLLLVFVDLRNAYDTVDRYRLIHTLEGYGVGGA